jgi:hypothetical protein
MTKLQLSQIKKMSTSNMYQSLTAKGKTIFIVIAAAAVSGLFRIAYNYIGR